MREQQVVKGKKNIFGSCQTGLQFVSWWICVGSCCELGFLADCFVSSNEIAWNEFVCFGLVERDEILAPEGTPIS